MATILRKRARAVNPPRLALPLPFPLPPQLWTALSQRFRFAPQERRAVEWALRGLQNKDVAEQMGLEESTVQCYFNRVYRRVGVGHRAELIARLCGLSHSIESAE